MVEVQMIGVADPHQAAERAQAFLSQMMPEIMSCLPDWELLRQAEAAEEALESRAAGAKGQGPQ
jgi:hypothetical protein